MQEYGASLAELEERWTPGLLLLMVNKIVARYKTARGGGEERIETQDLLHGDWASG